MEPVQDFIQGRENPPQEQTQSAPAQPAHSVPWGHPGPPPSTPTPVPPCLCAWTVHPSFLTFGISISAKCHLLLKQLGFLEASRHSMQGNIVEKMCPLLGPELDLCFWLCSLPVSCVTLGSLAPLGLSVP